MVRGPVRINTYDQRQTPRSVDSPYIRPVDTGGAGIAEGIANIGRAFSNVAQTEIQIDQLRQAREEDDARVYVSREMARARARANEIRRTAFQEAPDGWRGATQRVSQDWGALREEALRKAPTTAAQRFLSEAFDSYQPLMLEDVAGEEQGARQNWRIDTVRESIRQEGSSIAADPRFYDQAVSQQRELINGMSDLDANQRRDLLAVMEEEFATTYVAGMIERDPSGALRSLRDPDAGGAYAQLSGSQRTALENRASAEIERRAAQWRASVREQVEGARDLWRLGEQSPNAPSVETVRSALGDAAAAAYSIEMNSAQATSSLQGLSSQQLERIAAMPPLNEGSIADRLANTAQRAAASNILEQRADPMAYIARSGNIDTSGFVASLQSNDFAAIGRQLRTRQAIATEYGRQLGMPATPLMQREAAQLRQVLDGLDPVSRVSALSALRATDATAYRETMAQVYADNPAALGGAMVIARRASIDTGRGRIGGAAVGRRMLDGAALLNPQRQVQGESQRDARSTFEMPSNAALEGAFQSYVGDAYANRPQERAQAFEAFRAYFAGAANERGLNASALSFVSDGVGGGSLGGDPATIALAGEAAAVSVGHLRDNRFGGRVSGLPSRVYLPWGMDEDQFLESMRQGWPTITEANPMAQLPSDNPRDYDYARDQDGFYVLYYRGAPVRDGEGGFVRARPRLRD